MFESWRQQLIKELLNLYSKIVHLVLKDRESSFRAADASGAHSAVLSELEQNLLNAAAQPKKEGVGIENLASSVDAIARSKKIMNSPFSKVRSRLADYFSKNRSTTQLRPQISLDLERETWKHINKAMLHAKEGDLNNAHLQAQIAVEALHELSHYLPEEHYERFRDEVLTRLEDMQNELERIAILGQARSQQMDNSAQQTG